MPRPKDENGRPLPAAHIRLCEADQLRQTAILAISEGSLSAHMTMRAKATLADAAIDHVVDGGGIPKSIGEGRPMGVWNTAVRAIKFARQKAA